MAFRPNVIARLYLDLRPDNKNLGEGYEVLRRAENTKISFSPGWITGKGWLVLHVGAKSAFRIKKMHKDEYAQYQQWQAGTPWHIARIDQRTYWLFQGKFYWDNDNLNQDAIYALLVTRQQRETQRINRAQQIVAMGSQPRESSSRGSIPEDVKHYVWTRDQGRCRSCGSATELQFDHVIPIAMGGSSQAENLQILCGPCNRRKGASITVR